MPDWIHVEEQPDLREMLDDPIVRRLMARDGVARGEIVALMMRLRRTWSADRPDRAAACCCRQ